MSRPLRCRNCGCRHAPQEWCQWGFCPRCEARATALHRRSDGSPYVICVECDYSYRLDSTGWGGEERKTGGRAC